MNANLPRCIMEMNCYVLLDDEIRPSEEPALRLIEEKQLLVNESFDSAEDCIVIELSDPASTKTLRIGDLVSMNNSYVGKYDGLVGLIVYESKGTTEGKSEQYRVPSGYWIWTGQDSSQLMADCMYGTPVIDSDNRVVGFFRFAGKGAMTNWIYCTGIQGLIRDLR